ncbi:MAG: alkene reductase [Verrucomicrobia bacterium]|nr:alkene reductase [Verrucomicrobiota bacterium]
MNTLFEPLKAGSLELSNRILMAPLTRCRADADHVPTPVMAEYYSQRCSAGLIIAEATMVMEGNSAFWREPGIYSKAQVDGWSTITDQVHQKGGKIVLQLWHGGRACHPLLNNGRIPVAPSAIPITNDEVHTPEGKKPYVTPRELLDEEIPEIVQGFRKAAQNALEAGFDGVEVHGANGYLLDEFLRDGSNHRHGTYGGSLENRSRLMMEVVGACCEIWGGSKVGLRLSPLNSYNSMADSDPVALSEYMAEKLNPMGLAYLHVMRADFFQQQTGDILTPIRQRFKGVLVANMGYSAEEAAQAIQSGQIDAVAFGVPFLANPDLPERFKQKAALNEPRPNLFYTQGAEGYTDYPSLKQS